MKKKFSNLIIVLMLVVGLSLILYPSFSNYWNSLSQSRVITNYLQTVNKMDNVSYENILKSAREYNEKLYECGYTLVLNDKQRDEYEKQLDIMGNGMMGYIEIPKISCFLPIYHYSTDSVLQVAIGHIEGSSLPVGGENTHAILSGHRGLPSSVLFTDLDKMETGDTFTLQVLGESLVYEVDRILTVLPHEIQSLAVEEGEDYCTLMTCTPYGINTHRLLVRGHRVAQPQGKESKIRVSGDALRISTFVTVTVAATPVLVVIFILILIRTGKKRKNDKQL